MCRSVGSRKRFGNDEICPCKANQHEHHDLASPTAKKSLDHADRSNTIGRLCSDIPVDWQCTKDGYQHQNDRGEGSEDSRAFKCNRRLVAESAEIIDPAQTHNQPPGIVPFGRCFCRRRQSQRCMHGRHFFQRYFADRHCRHLLSHVSSVRVVIVVNRKTVKQSWIPNSDSRSALLLPPAALGPN